MSCQHNNKNGGSADDERTYWYTLTFSPTVMGYLDIFLTKQSKYNAANGILTITCKRQKYAMVMTSWCSRITCTLLITKPRQSRTPFRLCAQNINDSSLSIIVCHFVLLSIMHRFLIKQQHKGVLYLYIP